MKSIDGKRLALFGGFVLLTLCIFSTIYYKTQSGLVLTLLMLTPALGVVLTRLITREGTKELFLAPHFKGNIKWYILAYFATPVVAYLGAALYFVIFQADFDPLGSAYAANIGAASGGEYAGKLLLLLPLAVLVNPIAGLVQCFGEEFAWRGYLLPKLCKLVSAPKAVLLSGLLWGLWHSPIIAMGYNYGTEHPALGVLAMILLTVVLGTISSYLFFRTKSVWVPVVFHAAVNAMDLFAPSTLFMSKAANPFVGPDLLGVIGGAGLIALAVVCFIRICKKSRAPAR